MPKKETKTGFTLIELLVVIAIIGLLSSIVLVALGSARAKSRNARRKADAHQLSLALELYFDNNSDTYPHNGAVGNPNNETDIQNLSSFLVPKYMGAIPNDPLSNIKNYKYIWKNGTSGNPSEYGLLIPFSNDHGTDCQFQTSGGSQTWFSSAPSC